MAGLDSMSIFGSSAAAATDTSGEPTDDIMTGFRRRSRRRRLQVDDGYEGGNFLDDDDENYPDSAAAGRSGGGAATPPLLRGTSSAATAGTSSSSQPSDRSRDSSYGAALGLEVACLVAENLALHPFLVLRRQCQVSGEAQLYHLAPVPGLLPVAFRLCQWQGVGSLFKGLSSTLIVRGLQMAAEDAAVKVADLPKELSAVSPREVWRHLSLKALGLAAAAPFFTVSVIETVQSDIASEKPGVLDVFIEGFNRLLGGFHHHSGTRLMMPMWYLLPPTVAYGLAHYMVSQGSSSFFRRIFLMGQKLFGQNQLVKGYRDHLSSEGASRSYSPEVSSKSPDTVARDLTFQMLGQFVADAVLYPLDTVLMRLHIQGTRTIIDNLDSGTSVVPVLTRYDGLSDCLETIRLEEGLPGFYRGFGVLVLQYTLRLVLIKACTVVAKEVVAFVIKEAPGVLEYKKSPSSSAPTSPIKDISAQTASQQFLDEEDPYRHVRHAMRF